MTSRKTFTRRTLGQTVLAGATLIGAPLPPMPGGRSRR